ncbi:hypothetical protein IWX50DRAFT_215319 [Phyllosticta citricarpa]
MSVCLCLSVCLGAGQGRAGQYSTVQHSTVQYRAAPNFTLVFTVLYCQSLVFIAPSGPHRIQPRSIHMLLSSPVAFLVPALFHVAFKLLVCLKMSAIFSLQLTLHVRLSESRGTLPRRFLALPCLASSHSI